jgi:hypothetical protein
MNSLALQHLTICSAPSRKNGIADWNTQMLIVLACLAGVLLGLTFNVVVLLPVTAAGALAYAFLSHGEGVGSIAAAIPVPAVSLQAGYMIGLTGRDMLAQLLAWLSTAQSKRI